MLVDRLGRPIQVGDTVVTKPYGSSGFYLTTKVLKVNRTRIVVESNHKVWKKHYKTDSNYEWRHLKQTTLSRYPREMIIVTEQLAHNKSTYPELLL
jgi:hypothetical protein